MEYVTGAYDTYKNPMNISNIGDPFILRTEEAFYLYATSDPGSGFKVWVSDDMKNWEQEGLNAYLRTRNGWGSGDYWAPEVYAMDDGYYMIYSAREKETNSLRIGLAFSSSPKGPFTDVGDESRPFFDPGYAVIDGHIFVDEDGSRYLFYSRDCSENVVGAYHESHIYGVALKKDMSGVVGEPALLTTPDLPWEQKSGNYRWNEGPFVVREGETYFLFYSTNYFADSNYSVGYATASNPLGPYKKSEANQVLVADEGISGPGHNMLLKSPFEGLYYNVYHTHTIPAMGGGNRTVNVDLIRLEKDGSFISAGPSLGAWLTISEFEDLYANSDLITIKKDHIEIGYLTDGIGYVYPKEGKDESYVYLEPGELLEISLKDGRAIVDGIVLYGSDQNQTISIHLNGKKHLKDVTWPRGEQLLTIEFGEIETDEIKIVNDSEVTIKLSEVMLSFILTE